MISQNFFIVCKTFFIIYVIINLFFDIFVLYFIKELMKQINDESVI